MREREREREWTAEGDTFRFELTPSAWVVPFSVGFSYVLSLALTLSLSLHMDEGANINYSI